MFFQSTENKTERDRSAFEKRYCNLMLMLISNSPGGSSNNTYYAHPTSLSRNSSMQYRAMDIE